MHPIIKGECAEVHGINIGVLILYGHSAKLKKNGKYNFNSPLGR
jgi:hypothetical protein